MDLLQHIKNYQGRLSWDEYFINLAFLVSNRSACERLHVGCILVKDSRVIAAGYNGFLPKASHKSVVRDNHEQMTTHAEQNAIIQAAYHGVSLKGSSVFCTNLPCSICAKMIINAGIKKIYYRSGYADELSQDMLQEAHVELIHLETKQQGEDS